MRETKETRWENRLFWGIVMLLTALMIGMFVNAFSITGYAMSSAKVTARSAKIRNAAGTDSAVLASVEKGDALSITGKVTGSDGKVWYQVLEGGATGYIRSDLIEITDGTTPPTVTAGTPATNTGESAATATPGDAVTDIPITVAEGVTAVNPVSATTNASSVRVRSNPSTVGQIVASVPNGAAITVLGTIAGADGATWYQVNYNSDGTNVNGFIRSDFVNLSAELVPVNGTNVEDEGLEGTQAETETVLDTGKDWDTQLDGDKWYLIDNRGQQKYEIQQFFNLQKNAEELQKMYTEEHKSYKKMRMAVIILAVLFVLMIGAAVFLLLKLGDSRNSNAARGGSSKGGSNRPPKGGNYGGDPSRRGQPSKPQGTTRTSGNAKQSNGTRQTVTRQSAQTPVKQRTVQPSTAQPPTARTQGEGQRPQTPKPVAGNRQGTTAHPKREQQGTIQTQRSEQVKPRVSQTINDEENRVRRREVVESILDSGDDEEFDFLNMEDNQDV